MTNNIGPRLSGSPQAQRAVDYVADEMRKLGLEVRLQRVMVPHWVRGIETAELVEFRTLPAGRPVALWPALVALRRRIRTR